MKQTVLFTCFCFLISCNTVDRKFEFFENGTVKFEYELINGHRNGKQIEYYPNGKIASELGFINDTIQGVANYYYESGELKETVNWLNGKTDGTDTEFYKSGRIKSYGNYFNNLQSGLFYYYDSIGNLQTVREYLLQDSTSHLNNVYCFNKQGDTILTRSNFYKLILCCDTVLVGTKFTAKIDLVAPYFKKSRMYVYFEIPGDKEHLRRLFSGNYTVTYEYFPRFPGKYLLRGYIEERHQQVVYKDSIQMQSRFLYFDTSFVAR
jgi:hypothetical protein